MSYLTRITTTGLLAHSGQVTAPISVHAVAADMDVIIERVWLPLSQPGFTALIRSRWFVWVNAQHSPRRRRFTIGHELGHVALEHQGIVFFFDGGEPRHMQTSANRFSAELLMPENLVYQEHAQALEAGLSVGDLSDIFLVDKRVAELRLEELSLKL